MPKNIVICLDGTGNGIGDKISNVLKCFRSAEKSDRQHVYYSQGVGVMGEYRPWFRLRHWFTESFLGKLFGYGLDKRVTDAYQFLVQHYAEGDEIYIFGYSRGAYAARALAGLIYTVGVIKPDQQNLIGAGYLAYLAEGHEVGATSKVNETSAVNISESQAESFRRITQPHASGIKFLGLFDTVGSVFSPSRFSKTIWPLSLMAHPLIYQNPVVETVCHAVAINERRALFPVSLWPKGQNYKRRKYAPDDRLQNVHEVWFEGAHGDIGGGGHRKDSARSQIAFGWMIDMAEVSGLLVTSRTKAYVGGQGPYSKTTQHKYPKPNYSAPTKDSLRGMWWLLEFLPSLTPKVLTQRKQRRRLHIPLGRQRTIPEDGVLFSKDA